MKKYFSHLNSFWFITGFIFTSLCLAGYYLIAWPFLRGCLILYLSLGYIFAVTEIMNRNFGHGWRDSTGKLYINPHSGICSFSLAQIQVLTGHVLVVQKIIGIL